MITLGQGTTANSLATDTATFSLTVNAGDYVFMALNAGATTITPATVHGPGAGQKAWTYLGNVPFQVYPQLWVLENALAGSGNVTVQIVGRTYLFVVAQIYSGVASTAQSFVPQEQASVNPSVAPAGALFFNVTVPGSMGCSAFSWGAGTTVGLTLTNPRQIMQGGGQTIALADQLFSAIGQQQLFLPWSTTSTTPNQARVSVLFAPTQQVTPPPTGDIPAIVLAIQQWRQQAQIDKVYLMRGAQRTARLAQLYALADQLKQAQIAQMQ